MSLIDSKAESLKDKLQREDRERVEKEEEKKETKKKGRLVK